MKETKPTPNPWVKAKLYLHPGLRTKKYKLLNANSTGRNTVCFLVKNELNVFDDFSSENVLTIRIQDDVSWSVSTCCFPSRWSILQLLLKRTRPKTKQRRANVITDSDANSKHTLRESLGVSVRDLEITYLYVTEETVSFLWLRAGSKYFVDHRYIRSLQILWRRVASQQGSNKCANPKCSIRQRDVLTFW